jgi:hypothetical protein
VSPSVPREDPCIVDQISTSPAASAGGHALGGRQIARIQIDFDIVLYEDFILQSLERIARTRRQMQRASFCRQGERRAADPLKRP